MCKQLYLNTALLATLSVTSLGAWSAEEPIASISQPEGKVLVGQGEKIITAPAGMPLRSGDRVFTLENSKVAVVYQDNCVVNMEANSLLVLKDADECRRGLVMVRNVDTYQNQAIGQTMGGQTVSGAGVAAASEAVAGATTGTATAIDAGVASSTGVAATDFVLPALTIGAFITAGVVSGSEGTKEARSISPP
jgi:hypothetical protein